MRYTKKPVTIEAEQWDGTAKCLSELVSFTNGCCFLPMDADEAQLIIKSREGDVKADVGDYVIKGFTKDYGYHCWVCKPDYFKDAYEEMIGNETPSPSSPQVLVEEAKIKMLEEMKDWAADSMDKGATGNEILYSHNDFFSDCDTWIKKCEENISKFKQSVDGQDQDEPPKDLYKGLIEDHIEKMWGGLEMASVQHFMDTGKINGSFRLRLISMLKFYEWRLEKYYHITKKP